MKKLLILLLATILLLIGCNLNNSNNEFEYKINQTYSDKLSPEFAINILSFVAEAVEYNKIAFKDMKISQQENESFNKLSSSFNKIFDKRDTYNDSEKDICTYIETYYMDYVSRIELMKSYYDTAKINENIGLKPNTDYLKYADEITTLSKESTNKITGFKKYIR